ncbi:UDP-2,3-diacylglucosamine diphosphatase [Microscilla marina]|uniref:Metallophosphoesterase n=1 Tax=Microscilla marina ATCC 23134 TaxID=313606 RepID=A1ZGP4_MICM2|nr:UDP-2,3-diacylglucosamine diphosphatase [Microscilla marina]EAY30661.1 metallophosphoesterase [Microscilla marina ATCC 23134]
MNKRDVEIVVISDVHLGTYGCQSKELTRYLKSIKPKKLILNGDIIDIWQFNKRFWPKTHFAVIKQVINMLLDGTEVYYLTGNHDEMLRRFSNASIGNFHLLDKMSLTIDDKKAWIFHGDVFDATMKNAKWLARLGGIGYDLLIMLNSLVNFVLTKMGREKMSLSKRIKNSVKSAIKYIQDFEQVASDLAIENNFDYLICGHIHQPQIKVMQNTQKQGEVLYLNSGDWIENLTSLEYNNGTWKLYQYDETQVKKDKKQTKMKSKEENFHIEKVIHETVFV